MLDPLITAGLVTGVLIGLWLLTQGNTSEAVWFFFAWFLYTLVIAVRPLGDTYPAIASVYALFGALTGPMTLAGTLVLLQRSVPRWLIPGFLLFGVVRTGIDVSGFRSAGAALGLVGQAAIGIAGWQVLKATPPPGAERAFRILGPSLLAFFALGSAGMISVAVAGNQANVPLLAAWLLSCTAILGVELYAVAARRTSTLRGSLDSLERMVENRTRELAKINESLKQEAEERQRVVLALKESEARYRTVSELSSDFSFSLRIDPERGIEREWVTEAFERITGYPADMLDGDRWASLLHGEERPATPEDIDFIRSNDASSTIRYRVVRPDGDVRWLDVTVRSQESTEDGVARVLGTARDVTDAHLSEEARLELERQVEAAQRVESLGMLTGGIAHDFNNLLAVILGNTRLVQDELPDASPSGAKLARIRSAAEHAARLTEQMLTYSGKAIVSLAPIELPGLIRDLSELLHASVGAQCRLDISIGEDAVVEGDVTRLSQVILNLITNAYEALEQGSGNVHLRTGLDYVDAEQLGRMTGAAGAAPGEYAWFEVTDDGCGMDDETRGRIFEPFYTTKFSGRGLGLASVLGIIRAHRGLVEIDSEVGRGTRIRVLLPPSMEEPVLELVADPVATTPERVLVVDDDEAVLELAGEFLRRAGYESHRASGGHEAIELFAKKAAEIDVVVLDLTMPDIDGREVFKALRRIRADVPVVLATGYSRGTLEESFPDASMVSFLRKPYEPEQLLAAIRKASTGQTT